MTYHPNSPDSNDDPSVSQGELLDNFSKLNSDFAINHSALTASLNAGFHTKIQFPTGLGASPDLIAPNSSLYTKLISSVAELFFQNDATATDEFQLTNLSVGNTGTNYTFTSPWGIKFQMGSGSGGNITFHDAYNAGTFVGYTALVSGIAATNPIVTGFSNTGLTYTPTGTVYYFAMGTE